MGSTKINSVSHNIVFQWNLKVEEIPKRSPFSRQKPKILRSSTYGLEDIKDMFFFLDLEGDHSSLSVKGHSSWSFQITYAFAVVKERAFSVKKFERLEFLENLDLSKVSGEEEIVYHCMISAQRAVVPKGAEPDLKDNDDEKLKQQHVEFEDTLDSERQFDGEIPNFTIDMAKGLMPHRYCSIPEKNRVLGILAVEYLMKSLTAQNVSSILEIAVEKGINILQGQCFDFLNKKCTVNASLA